MQDQKVYPLNRISTCLMFCLPIDNSLQNQQRRMNRLKNYGDKSEYLYFSSNYAQLKKLEVAGGSVGSVPGADSGK